MRVITGSAKGRILKMPGGGQTRPAMDKVKGSTFNIIASLVDGARFLDLFAGSGNLGIEGLSRGGSYGAFVDMSRECAKTIKENLVMCKLDDKAEVFCMDVMKFLQTSTLDPFDIVFIDPPYLKGLLDPILKYIPQCPLFTHDTLFIIERQIKDIIGVENNPDYKLLDERFYGATVCTYFRMADKE